MGRHPLDLKTKNVVSFVSWKNFKWGNQI